MNMENHLSRAAKCLLLAVEGPDPEEQAAMLNMAQACLDKLEQARNGSSQPGGIVKPHRSTQLPARKGRRRKTPRCADPAGAVRARGAKRPWPTKRNRPR
jgi:hypothetical protein